MFLCLILSLKQHNLEISISFCFPVEERKSLMEGLSTALDSLNCLSGAFSFFPPSKLQTTEMKKVIKDYNKMAAVLLEFEIIYHRAWCRFADQARNALCASLLVRHPETKVNMIYSLHCCYMI